MGCVYMQKWTSTGGFPLPSAAAEGSWWLSEFLLHLCVFSPSALGAGGERSWETPTVTLL